MPVTRCPSPDTPNPTGPTGPAAGGPPAPLLALSCRQPLAGLLAAGWLTTSTRWFAPAHRGPTAVHASQWLGDREFALWGVPAVRHACRHLFGVTALDQLPRGGLVGLAHLIEVDPVEALLAGKTLAPNDAIVLPPIRDGFLLRFAQASRLPTLIPCPGAGGLFPVPPHTAAACLKALPVKVG